MPFDIAPQITKAPAKFASVADTILRGCRMTEPTPDGGAYREKKGRITHACVWGAYVVGHCGTTDAVTCDATDTPSFRDVMTPYAAVYGATPVDDYVRYHRTREQIAERIRAL